MKNRHWTATLAGIYGAGALTMYLLDPQRGKRRRIMLKDALVHSGHQMQKFAGRFRDDFEHRLEGAAAETENLFHHEKVSDYVLQQRVRSALGRTVSHPHAIEVSCKNGSVALNGWIMADELENLDRAVKSIRGVQEVSTFLNTTNHPEHISDLQGGKPWRYRPEFLRKSWSPTAQVIAGSAGLGLIAYGLMRRESAGAVAGLGGAALLARSIFNMPLHQIVGAGSGAGLRIQKTFYVAASPADLYEFWVNPENFPKIFTHLKEVTRVEDDTYRWQVMGPAGIPISWTAMITRRVPGSIVEWHSAPDSAIENHGSIRLDAAKDGGTRVHIQMTYNPPAGLLGHAFAALLGIDPRSLMNEDFARLKAFLEEGKSRVHEMRKGGPEQVAIPAS
ncbi:MAG: SRPBCC family protein [Acidobacteriia bacterium]|nr:SRPBCC family protein [Terriglobia bacterium]